MKFLTQEQFTEMWKLQDSLNTATSGEDWKEKNQNWNLAIKAEIMEFFDHIGWKWWKEPDKVKKPTDLQARLEFVDIWHFLLSSIIENSNLCLEKEWIRLNSYVTEAGPTSGLDLKASIEMLDSWHVNNVQKVLYLTDGLELCEWSWEELYKAYIGKVALNNFRQDHGYKEGTYQKIWKKTSEQDKERGFGLLFKELEDNYFLEQILSELSLTPEALTYEAVYHKLDIAYLVRQNN